MLLIENVKKSFGGTAVLDGVSLSLRKGRSICIAGKNASGKTTLLKMICGLLSADSGSIKTDGRISFVPQQPALLTELSVQDNLKLWYCAQNKVGPKWLSDSIETKLGLTEYRRKKVKTLSGGMQKRLSIAAALVSTPDFLLLDEPFASLDAAACKELEQLLLSLKAAGVGIIFTSHIPEHIHALADELLVLKNGGLENIRLPKEMSPQQLGVEILQKLYQP